jgi:bis(5'-nucleosyl)-tetraphosphatase (symmetrical)
MHYLVGDPQGCCKALGHLLDVVGFSPSRDHVWVLGDLVNRGPDSVGTLERLMALGDAATCLLGNHDLHALAVAHGVRPAHPSDTLDALLTHRGRDRWLAWLCGRPLAVRLQADGHDLLMVHAGVVPQWTPDQTLALAAEVSGLLSHADELADFLPQMYGNQPARWHDALQGADRWRMVINTLTRCRFVHADGSLELTVKEGLDQALPGTVPWFDAPGRQTERVTVAFGHWSALGRLERPNLLGLDTGCVWGRDLSAVALKPGGEREWFQVGCAGGVA